MAKNLRLDPEYGVNPSIQKCNLCKEDIGILMFGAALKGKEAPRETFGAICEKCDEQIAEHSKLGFTVFHIHEDYEEAVNKNPKITIKNFITGYSVLKRDCELANDLREKVGGKESIAMNRFVCRNMGLIPEGD